MQRPLSHCEFRTFDPLRRRLRRWQQVRTWARLIREAEFLWHVDVRELRRLGAIELSQLVEEVPPIQRTRVNRWLNRYAVATRLICTQNHKPDSLQDSHKHMTRRFRYGDPKDPEGLGKPN
ncbi:hypothetical protein N9996_02805 [Synechococcus sp. AH-603-M21]|nr:hypothetical protein [Synechococcus sp. AH-603-M21]